jgi:hypothetical protein
VATGVVKALVPTALAGVLLAQEFPSASLNADGTLFTVVISGASYADAIARIRAWVAKARLGPVLVTDGVTRRGARVRRRAAKTPPTC